MWDQLMALRWVKDNILSFGGDPDDITVGGNSMGGESVSALSIVPQGKGLFTKVKSAVRLFLFLLASIHIFRLLKCCFMSLLIM